MFRERIITQAHQWITERAYILDTETTGLDKQAQVVEIVVTDIDGQVIFQRYLRPSVMIDPEAQAVHGITLSVLSNEPQWPQIADELIPLLTSRPLIIFNEKFDLRLIAQTAKAFAMDTRWIKQLQSQCSMELAAHCIPRPKQPQKDGELNYILP
ncbi:exonuclease domain-containing protein [Xenorhabdus stockiae]|uniref:3'-5' exonuclease n=1 Tax=Xenorhabdus stockiae TaxID=351614 RepID=UPI003CED2124